MSEIGCAEVQAQAAELVRAESGPALEHAKTCAACAQVVAGAKALGGALRAWESPAPPENMVARTLARVRLAEALAPRESGRVPAARDDAAPAGPPGLKLLAGGTPLSSAPVPGRRRRRSSVEILATWALPGPPPPGAAPVPTERLGLRVAIQAAAAVLLFVACTVFSGSFYPVFVDALEDSRATECQAHLARIGAAIQRFAKEHPDALAADEPLKGKPLRDALVKGGYVKESDLTCPSVHAASAGALSYFLRLPEGKAGALAWDHFGNHPGSKVNVVDEAGKPVLLEGEALWLWMSRDRR